jgi:hypothetical protein
MVCAGLCKLTHTRTSNGINKVGCSLRSIIANKYLPVIRGVVLERIRDCAGSENISSAFIHIDS